MSLSKIMLIKVIAICMFSDQIWQATVKLLNVPMVISTETLNIEEITPPLMMICPLRQYNSTKVSWRDFCIVNIYFIYNSLRCYPLLNKSFTLDIKM